MGIVWYDSAVYKLGPVRGNQVRHARDQCSGATAQNRTTDRWPQQRNNDNKQQNIDMKQDDKKLMNEQNEEFKQHNTNSIYMTFLFLYFCFCLLYLLLHYFMFIYLFLFQYYMIIWITVQTIGNTTSCSISV